MARYFTNVSFKYVASIYWAVQVGVPEICVLGDTYE